MTEQTHDTIIPAQAAPRQAAPEQSESVPETPVPADEGGRCRPLSEFLFNADSDVPSSPAPILAIRVDSQHLTSRRIKSPRIPCERIDYPFYDDDDSDDDDIGIDDNDNTDFDDGTDINDGDDNINDNTIDNSNDNSSDNSSDNINDNVIDIACTGKNTSGIADAGNATGSIAGSPTGSPTGSTTGSIAGSTAGSTTASIVPVADIRAPRLAVGVEIQPSEQQSETYPSPQEVVKNESPAERITEPVPGAPFPLEDPACGDVPLLFRRFLDLRKRHSGADSTVEQPAARSFEDLDQVQKLMAILPNETRAAFRDFLHSLRG